MFKTISILGCGWLGLPLAEQLILKKYLVKGSTTSAAKLSILSNKNIEPFLINLNPLIGGENVEQFFISDILIINFPPKRIENIIEFFSAQIQSLILSIEKSSINKIIFISSTSVYDETNEIITENSEINPVKNSRKALLLAENMLLENLNFKTTVLRFSGLAGPGRHPGNFFAGKKNIFGGNSPVNFIHLNDCIGIILKIIEQEVWGEIFNASADEHPVKNIFYTKAAEKLNLPQPEFLSEKNDPRKIISNKKVKEILNYSFKYSDPMDMI
jgi:nucleoside-diphosphate-sugar epimerase